MGMIFLGVVAALLLGNALCGILYGKMWFQNRVIDRTYPNFRWQVFWNVVVAGMMAFIGWMAER